MKRAGLLTLCLAALVAVGVAASPAEAGSHAVRCWQAGSSPQATARDTPAPRTGAGRVRGRVLAAETGAPIRRAVVHASGAELREPRSTMTDAEGKYEIRDLPSGTYHVFASKTGFLDGLAGGSRPGDLGKPVRVVDGQVATADDVLLTRACAIAGRIVDEFGDPVANVQVRVFRSLPMGGVRRIINAAAASTNDLGQYRAFGLQPGTYFIAADNGMRAGGNEVSDHAAYAATYYPATANFSEAAPVQLSAGQDLAGIDVMLALVRTARIGGTALDSRGRPAADSNVYMSLVQQGSLVNASMGTGSFARVQQDGSFVLNGVPPGDYLLELAVRPPPAPQPAAGTVASGGSAQPREYGRVRISVGGNDISGVTVQANTGATVSGQVTSEGAAGPPAKARLSVIASPPTAFDNVGLAGSSSVPPGVVSAEGTFTLTGVFGDRVFRLGGLPSGWTLKAVYVNERDMTDTAIPFDGREQITGVQIVVTDRVTHLVASVTDEHGQPAQAGLLLVLPDDPAKEGPGSRFQRTVTVDGDVPSKVDNLPPGDYVAVAVASVPPGLDMYDPDFLDRARRAGVPFSLREGETKNLGLKLSTLTER